MKNIVLNRLVALKQRLAQGEISKFQYADELKGHHSLLFEYPEFLSGTDVEEIKISAEGVVVKSSAHQISMFIDNVDLHTTAFALLNRGRYERAETDFLKSVFKSGDIFFDIGANRGWFSLILARKSPSARVFAFEPIPSTYQGLKANIKLNRIANIESVCMGVSDRVEELDFLFAEDASGATSLKLVGQTRGHSALQVIRCPSTTLDAFCADHELVPSVIKIDVEGAELMVLRGGAQILTYTPVLLLELLRKWSREFNYHPNDVFALLESYGYQAWVLSSNDITTLERCCSVTDETTQTNFIFLHPVKHAAIIERWV